MVGLNYLSRDFRRCAFRGIPRTIWIGIPIAVVANPGFRSVFIYRLQQTIQNLRLGYASRIISYFVSSMNHLITGAEFIPGCEFGAGLVVRHPTGIVVGEGVSIGANCTLQHGVTFGLRNIVPENESTDSYPTVGSNCSFGTHAVVIGAIHIEDEVIVGANSVVLNSVNKGMKVVGVH
jgi:serine O-acetyltransferase